MRHAHHETIMEAADRCYVAPSEVSNMEAGRPQTEVGRAWLDKMDDGVTWDA